MKIDRLIGIITILLQRETITAPELAKRFEVSRRTINRDIEIICQAGIPLVTTQGHGGGITIPPGYKIDKSLFSHSELQTIFAGLQGITSVTTGQDATGILEKLSEQKNHIMKNDCFIIDLASYYKDSLGDKIEFIKTAIKQQRQLWFNYYTDSAQSIRTVNPYKIVFRWSSWYLFAFCNGRQDFRLFKLNRMWDLTITEENFPPIEIPPDKLNFEQHLETTVYTLKVIFDHSAKSRLIDEYGPNSFKVLSDGTLSFHRGFTNYDVMATWVLGFGSRVTVIEPVQLREDVIHHAKKTLEKHDI